MRHRKPRTKASYQISCTFVTQFSHADVTQFLKAYLAHAFFSVRFSVTRYFCSSSKVYKLFTCCHTHRFFFPCTTAHAFFRFVFLHKIFLLLVKSLQASCHTHTFCHTHTPSMYHFFTQLHGHVINTVDPNGSFNFLVLFQKFIARAISSVNYDPV